MDDALFSVFPPTPDTEWERQLTRELRGASYEEKLLWSPPELPAEAPRIKPYYRRTEAHAPAPLPRQRPFVYRSAYEVQADTTPAEVLHAAGKARQRDAEGLDLWGASADLVRLRAELGTAISVQAPAAGGDTRPKTGSNQTASNAKPDGSAPFTWRFFSSDFPGAGQELSPGLLYDLCGFRAISGGAGQSLEASSWDRLAGHLKAASKGNTPVGYFDAAIFANAGADIPSELAVVWAALHEMVDELDQRGIAPESWTGRCVLRVAAGPNFFLELAKFRALRLGWQLLSSALPGRVAPLPCPQILATAVSWNLAASDMHNNLLRLTTEAASSILGGADALSLPRFDAPSVSDSATDRDFSRRVSDNLALLLDKESHLLRVDDPAAGSWYLEQLTDDLGQQAWARFQTIEAQGGYTAALKNGLVQDWIELARKRKASALQQPGSGWIGVTRFRPASGAKMEASERDKTYVKTGEAASVLSRSFMPVQPWLAEKELSPATTDSPAPKISAP